MENCALLIKSHTRVFHMTLMRCIDDKQIRAILQESCLCTPKKHESRRRYLPPGVNVILRKYANSLFSLLKLSNDRIAKIWQIAFI